MRHLTLKALLITTVPLGMTFFLTGQLMSDNKGIASSLGATNSHQPDLSAEALGSAEMAGQMTEDKAGVGAAAAYSLASDELLYSFREEKQWPIASVTKLMTALVVRKLMPEEEIIIMDEEAILAAGEVGDFKTGERFRAQDLVQAMLIASSNDAAQALAAHYGQTEFVAEMNRLAAEIGMRDTAFVDPAGLSAMNLSTPADLHKLIRFIWSEDPEIFTITRFKTVDIIDIDGGRSRKLNNINLFAGRSNFLGGKTGQIPDSDGNLVSIFNLPHRSSPVVIVVLGANDRFKETEKILIKL